MSLMDSARWLKRRHLPGGASPPAPAEPVARPVGSPVALPVAPPVTPSVVLPVVLSITLLVLVTLWAAACGGSTTSTEPGGSGTSLIQPSQGADWPTYHHDVSRSGVSADQDPLGTVQQAWSSAVLDGDVYAQPLVVGGRVIVATEGDSVYALDATSGGQVWQAQLGEPVPGDALPCGNIEPSGITGTPAIDVGSATIYVVAFLKASMQHELFALDLQTGSVRWHHPVDPPGLSPLVEQQRGALALQGGRVYVPFGGQYGDCGPYKGAVVSAAMDGSGDLASYVVPTDRMAGIWNPGGPVVDGSGNIWVTTGNSASQSTFDYGNSVIKLSPQLQVLDYFAPSDWTDLNAGDVDLGSLGPVLVSNDRALVVGKSGVAYLLDAASLGEVGGELDSAKVGGSAFGAAARAGNAVFVPCSNALVGLRIVSDKITVMWTVGGGAGPPVVAGGAVWTVGHDGTLKALDPQTGAERFSANLGEPVSRFVSPAAAGGSLFVPSGRTVIAFSLR